MSAPGSDRAINFFIQEYYPEVEQNYKKAKFGVYDVLEDRWINSPKKKDPQDDPDIKFGPELRVAREKVEEFSHKANKYFSVREKYLKTFRPEAKVRSTTLLEQLWELADAIENERKMAYR